MSETTLPLPISPLPVAQPAPILLEGCVSANVYEPPLASIHPAPACHHWLAVSVGFSLLVPRSIASTASTSNVGGLQTLDEPVSTTIVRHCAQNVDLCIHAASQAGTLLACAYHWGC